MKSSSSEDALSLEMTARWRRYAEADGRTSAETPPSWWQSLASLLSAIYGCAVAVRRLLYRLKLLRAKKLPGLTISVGNLAAGGTGKSPVTMRLAELLLAAGFKPAILTRGYGAGMEAGDSLALLGGHLLMLPFGPAATPDEGRMQSAALPSVPVIAGSRRYVAAQRFLREHPSLAPTHWLLDDGFQHWQLQRDADVVLLDARVPLPRLLPRGLGREEASALRRAGLILVTRGDAAQPSPAQLATIAAWSQAPVIRTTMQTGRPGLSSDGQHRFDASRHAPACLVSAIAQPQTFAAAVKDQLGIAVAAELRLPDHSPIDRGALIKSAAACRSILTTAKDYWRNPGIFAALPQPVFILPLTVLGADEALQSVIQRLSSAFTPV